jgi:hypothetical protein
VEFLKPLWLLKWAATILLILGAGLTAFGITPINTVFFFLGSVGWTIVGKIWRDGAVMAVNGTCAVLYLLGWVFPGLFDAANFLPLRTFLNV